MEITIDVAPREIYVGEEVRVWGDVTERGMPVPEIDVTLYVNGTPVKTVKTDRAGKYEFFITFEKPGIYEIFAETGKPVPLADILKYIGVALVIIGTGLGVGYAVRERGKK